MRRALALLGAVGVVACPAARTEPVKPDPPEVDVAPLTPSSAKSDPAPPRAISGDLPNAAGAQLQLHASCRELSCTDHKLFPPPLPPDAQAPATMWTQDIARGMALHLPPSSWVTLYGVVLEGRLDVSLPDGPGGAQAFSAWEAFRVAGAGVTIAAQYSPGRVVLALATDGRPVSEAITAAELTQGLPMANTASVERRLVAASDDLAIDGGAMHVRIVFDDGRASLQVITASADAAVPSHHHPSSWEVLGLITADGSFQLGADKEPPRSVASGAILSIPSATEHAWMPSGSSTLLAVQLYVPPGPEQRFKEMGAAP